MKTKNPIILAILDGWGISDNTKGNAVYLGDMENIKKLEKKYPWTKLNASGEWVGLPKGQMGNSEVGHIHIGSGRIKEESLAIINNAINDGSFENNLELKKAIEYCKANKSAFHLAGLFSDGGVHSHINHLLKIHQILVKNDIHDIYFHLFGDGRDTKPKSFLIYLKTLQKQIQKLKYGKIASVSGRYYAMDRDKRYDRTQKTFDVIVKHQGPCFSNIENYINKEYKNGFSDEFITPAFNHNYENSKLNSNDIFFFINFRPDRAIQLSSGLTNNKYIWSPHPFLNKLYFISMTKYSDSVKNAYILFKPKKIVNTIGEWLSKNGYNQLRIAETEKIAHITFFFDGGSDYFKNGLATPSQIKLKNADLCLIPSPKVATYDLAPKMSANKITKSVIGFINQKKYDLIVLNFANCDMVGHTGVLSATIEAVKTLDLCLKQIYDASIKNDYTLVITADHGNAEVMESIDGEPNKKHTTNKVPFIITNNNYKIKSGEFGLANISKTLLEIFELEPPQEMKQESIVIKINKGKK